MHVPYFSLREVINIASPEQLMDFYNVDILQCIAAGLLFLILLRVMIKSDPMYYLIVLITLFVTILAAPIVWHLDINNYLPIPLAGYFTPQYGSLFPIFPWAGFLIAGALVCKEYLDARDRNEEKEFIQTMIVLGIVLVVSGHIFLSDILPSDFLMIKPHPVFFFGRLGYVLLLLSFFWYYIEFRHTNKSFVLDISRESLLVYWLHLQVIYRHLGDDKNLAAIVAHGFNIWQASGLTFLIALLMVVAAKIWGGVKSKYKKEVSIFTAVLIVILILKFLLL